MYYLLKFTICYAHSNNEEMNKNRHVMFASNAFLLFTAYVYGTLAFSSTMRYIKIGNCSQGAMRGFLGPF